MQVDHIQPPNLSQPLGQYAQVTRDAVSGLVFVAGQVAVDEAGVLVGAGDITAQAIQTFTNVQRALEAAGSDLAHALKLMTYIVDADDLAGFRSARAEFFEQVFPTGEYPAHTLVVVGGLSAPEHLVEIEAVAVRA